MKSLIVKNSILTFLHPSRLLTRISTFVIFTACVFMAAALHVQGQSGGGQMLFYTNRDGNQEIYRMNSDGSNQTRLTNTPDSENGARWSPDGQQIIYGKRVSNTVRQIWLMNADGSNQRIISDGTGYHSEFGWSPDGQKILFAKGTSGNGLDFQIWTMNADGTNKTQISNGTPAYDHIVSWSPDGTKIATGRCQPLTFTCDIYVMNADGSNQINLTPENLLDDDSPRWTPDGTRIVYGKQFTQDDYNVAVMNADGSNKQVIAPAAYPIDFFPGILSPNGLKMLFYSLDESSSTNAELLSSEELYTIGTDGNDLVRLTNNSVSDNPGPWSPDSSRLSFTSVRDDTATEIYTMQSDGTSVARLTTSHGIDQITDWRFIASTSTGQNVSVQPANNITLSFENVTTPGVTTATPLNQSPPLPFNFSLTGSSVTYDITTSAVFTGNITLTFVVPNVPDALACSQLRILHYVNNNWDPSGNSTPSYNSADQTCTLTQTVSSLSPFVVAQSNPPANAEQCRSGKWQQFDVPRKFKNQGNCVQFVMTGR